MRFRFLTTALALFICTVFQAQELVTLTPATVSIAVGQTQSFAVPGGTDLSNVTFTVAPDTAARFDKSTLTLTGLAAGEVSLIGKDAEGNAITTSAKITVLPIKISALVSDASHRGRNPTTRYRGQD